VVCGFGTDVTLVVCSQVTRESKHDMLPEHREKLEQQRTLYRDTKEVGETQRTLATAPAVAAEHVHHHVHETIQPVINRETVQNTHVHTTIPIHEKIHDAPIVHEHTVLPTVSLAECEFEARPCLLLFECEQALRRPGFKPT
jgi:hypothetical protein